MQNASYNIIENKHYNMTDDYTNGVCIGKHPNPKHPQRYVTWEYKKDLGTCIYSYYWGHYFENENDAWRDYHQRLANNYDKPWEV